MVGRVWFGRGGFGDDAPKTISLFITVVPQSNHGTLTLSSHVLVRSGGRCATKSCAFRRHPSQISPLVSLGLKGTASFTVDGAGPVFFSGRPQPSLIVDGRQPFILMAVLAPNTVPSAIVALRGLSEPPSTSEAQMVPLLAALVNVSKGY